MKDKQYLSIVLIVTLCVLWMMDHSDMAEEKAVLEQQVHQADSIIHSYQYIFEAADSAYTQHNHNYDSLEHLRHENDTTNYRLSADSLERLWSERFGHDQH